METSFDILISRLSFITDESREIKLELDKHNVGHDCMNVCELILSSTNLIKEVKKHVRRSIHR